MAAGSGFVGERAGAVAARSTPPLRLDRFVLEAPDAIAIYDIPIVLARALARAKRESALEIVAVGERFRFSFGAWL